MELDFTYEDLLPVSKAMNERNDCAVIAIAVVTGNPYTLVHERFLKVGRRSRCHSTDGHIEQVLETFKLTLIDVTKFYEPSSLRTIVPQLPEQGNFLVTTRKHVSAVRKGLIQDWAEQRKLYVKGIFQVVPSTSDSFQALTPPPKRPRTVVIDYSQPTKAVHTIADIFFNDAKEDMPTYNIKNKNGNSRGYWSTFRAKVVAECVNNGINKTTAAVQVGKWMVNNGYHHRFMT